VKTAALSRRATLGASFHSHIVSVACLSGTERTGTFVYGAAEMLCRLICPLIAPDTQQVQAPIVQRSASACFVGRREPLFAALMIRFYDLRLTARNALEMRKYRTRPRSTGLLAPADETLLCQGAPQHNST